MHVNIFSIRFRNGTFTALSLQAEVYSSDFYAERAAREKLHEEKERLAAQLEFVKKQNSQLQEEMDSLGRYGVERKTLVAMPEDSSVMFVLCHGLVLL